MENLERVACSPQHFTWLVQKFSDLVENRPEATINEGIVYAILMLYKEIEPGAGEGKVNLYEALMAENLSSTAKEMNVPRLTLRGWIQRLKFST